MMQVNSYIFSFKNKILESEWKRKTIGIVLFIILFFLCGNILRFILIDDSKSYTRVTFHEMYAQDNIDTLFVGSSHCYRSFIPQLLDGELHQNTFNAGTSAQKMDGTLMVIKEADKYNDLRNIYLEVYYGMAFADDSMERTDMTSTYIISDYLKPSCEKIKFLLNASSPACYANSFIPARRNWNYLLDLDYITDTISKKTSHAYRNYDYTYVTDDNERYEGKGYVANYEIVEDWDYCTAAGWKPIDVTDISDEWLLSLNEIIEYCDKNNIALTLISTPISNYRLISVGNYDDYISAIRRIIGNREIEYYDFNLCKEEFFPDESELFMDDHHVNHYGAEKFCEVFSDVINGEVSDDEVFYSSYREKTDKLACKVRGISYNGDGLSDDVRHCKIVINDGGDYEYKISLIPREGEEQLIRDYSDSIYFDMPPDMEGKLKIDYRKIMYPKECFTQTISL